MSETIQDTFTRLQAFVSQASPTADTAPGSVLNELLLKLAATLQNPQYNSIEALGQLQSIQQALNSQLDTFSPIIDEIASNYGAVRDKGTLSTGTLQVVVTAKQGYAVIGGSTFIQSSLGLGYVTTQSYTIVTGTPNLSAVVTQLPLLYNGTNYYFLLPVVAAAVGPEYQVNNGTQFSVVAPTVIPNLVQISAYGNFTSAKPLATDKQLIASFKSTLSNTTLTSPNSIAAYLSTAFPSFQSLSAIGANAPEMLRSKRNIIGISTFGKADIYVRTTLGSETITLTKTGTKLSTGVWQVSLSNTDAPGFYRVLSVLPTPVNNVASTGTLVINSTTFGYTPDVFEYNNSITSALDARFTSYQTAVIDFQYNETPTVNNGATTNFDVTLSYQPYINDIQSIFQNNGTRVLCGDYLIKAALPCFVSVLISIVRNSSTDTAASIGIPDLQQDIFNYINSIPFGESVSASKIVQLCHTYPIKRVELPIVMNGNIYTVNGTSIAISNNDILSIPTSLSDGVTPNTTTFFIDYFQTGLNGTTPISNIGIALI